MLSTEALSSRAISTNEFPAKLSSDMAWVPYEFTTESSYTFELEDHHIEELECAMEMFKGLLAYCNVYHNTTNLCASRSRPRRRLHLP